MFFVKQLVRKSLFGVAAIQLHHQDTYKHLYSYYAKDSMMTRSELLKMLCGYAFEDKVVYSMLPDAINEEQLIVLLELLNTPKRRLALAFKTLDLDGNQVLTKEELSSICISHKDMSFKEFQSWIEKLQESIVTAKFNAHAVNGKIDSKTVAKLLMLAKPLPNSIKSHSEELTAAPMSLKDFSDIWKLLNEQEKLHDVLAFLGPKNIDLPLFEKALTAVTQSSGFTISKSTCTFLFELLDTDNSKFLENKEIINFFEAKFDARNQNKVVHCFNKAKESLEF